MVSNKDSDEINTSINPIDSSVPSPSHQTRIRKIASYLHRDSYPSSLLFNLAAFSLPAIYSTLSKLWIASIDSSKVVTTDVHTYIGVIVEVLNEGLPRAAWVIIGDKSTRNISSRLSLAYTLILTQALLGVLLTVIFLASADKLAAAFVPEEVRRMSIGYVRISSIQAVTSAIEVAVSSSTRALDHPDVPLVISSCKFVGNIVLDMLLLSRFHVGSHKPTVNLQAWIRMACDFAAAICGTVYFLFIALKMQRCVEVVHKARPSLRSITVLIRPGIWTFLESALRNAIYLWLISGIVAMGSDYATAWGVFNTIRWGVIMVPVQSLEASTLAFVGHDWGSWRAEVGAEIRRPKASRGDLFKITHHAWLSIIIALCIEVPFCLILSFRGIRSFAFYLSESEVVATITQRMWKTIDWCYIFYALATLLSSILLATTPPYYFLQAVLSNLFWMLPWAIAVSKIHMDATNAWTYHSVIFGGSLVFSFGCVCLVLGGWAWGLKRGKLRVGRVRGV